MIPQVPKRAADSHKGDYGRVLCIGGSRGMAGAISLTGMAALRSGAGWVVVQSASSQLQVIAGFEPCYMTKPIAEDQVGRIDCDLEDFGDDIDTADCVAFGPGLGRSGRLDRLSRQLFQEAAGPVVFDADGLNALAGRADLTPSGPRVLTPHPGEFRRLAQGETADEEGARQLASRLNSVVVLKGHRSIVTNGDVVHINATGNPGMATAGSGDVLTGVIAALIGQGMEVLDAAILGTHVHGLAGDLAADQRGQTSMVARDLIEFLPAAFQQCN